MNKKYFNSLVALRGFFILGIVIYHAVNRFESPFMMQLSFIYKYGGYFGNYVFFMLSGFLIAHNYKKRICEDELSLAAYMKKRIIKLYPLYFITNMICFIVQMFQGGWSATSLKALILNILMMTTGWIEDFYPYNGPCWFVSMLLLCYLVYWIVCALSKKDNNKYFLMLLSLTFIGYILRKNNFNVPFSYVHDGEGFLNFFMGCITYEIYMSLNEQTKKVAGVLGGVILVVLALASFKLGFATLIGEIGFVLPVLICPCIILCSIEVKIVSKILNLPPLNWLGRISMSIYYWHIPLSTLLVFVPSFMNINHQVRFLLYLALLLIWSSFSYLLIELGPNSISRNHKSI